MRVEAYGVAYEMITICCFSDHEGCERLRCFDQFKRRKLAGWASQELDFDSAHGLAFPGTR